MKKLLQIAVISTLLTACASGGNGRLADGNYQLTGLNAQGEQIGEIRSIDVPFNDQGFVIGAICIDPETTTVLIEQNGNFISKRKCTRR